MGFSITGTHVIFFVASVLVAGTVSGVFIAITTNISSSLAQQGDRIQEQLDTEFCIINDPENIPLSGDNNYRLFYLKNVGGKKLVTTNETFHLFIDGDIISKGDYNFSENTIQPADLTTIYVTQTLISSGAHVLRIVGPQAVEDEFVFEIS